jgi:Protein kinase domain
MDNKRYNSKTDIWSLGCILYEIMCLKLPFDGNSMAQLCQNIQTGNGGVISSSLHYSPSLKELVKDMLQRNSTLRPGINAILSRPVVKVRISCFLDASIKCKEFSHTVIHGMNILSAPAADQQSHNQDSVTGGNSNRDKVRVCDARNDGERVRRERDEKVPKKIVIKLDDNSPAQHDMKKRDAVEKEVRAIQERREEVLLREGLQRQKKQIENGKKDKIVGELQNDSRMESDKERQDRQKVDAEIRRGNEKAIALAAQQALERRRALDLEAREVSRRQARYEAVQPQETAREATEKRGALLRQDRAGNENVNQQPESITADRVLPPPPGNPTSCNQPLEVARAPKEGDVSAADKKNAKARENLLRFERDRLERHEKLEKKATDRNRLQQLRQNEIFVIPSAKQQEPAIVPLPLPQPPTLSSKVDSPKQRIIESEKRRIVPPVTTKHDGRADVTAEDASPRSMNVPVKTSSVETAAILKKHDSFMKTRGPSALIASSAGAGADDSQASASQNQKQHARQNSPHNPRAAAEDVCKEINAAGGDAPDFHVSPFIFSGSVVPWRNDNPAEKAGGFDAARDHRIEFSVDVAVEYSELFAQMQEVLEDEDYHTAGISAKNAQHRGTSDGECDETFGDEDEEEEDPLYAPHDA